MSNRQRMLVSGLALIVLTLVVQRGHAQEFLNFDDNDYVTENPVVKYGLSGEAIARAFTEAHAANWHPATWISHMIDVELFGLDAAKHQRTSLWIHAASVLMLFVFLSRATRTLVPSFLVAALFAIHPQHVESVHWISERKDVLAGFFWMATLLAYARYARSTSPARYLLVAVMLALGLLSKASCVTLPLVLLLADVWPLRRWRGTAVNGGESVRRLTLEKLPLIGLSGVVAAIAFATQSGYGTNTSLERLPFDVRIANAATAAATYAGKAVWPTDLAPFYPHPAFVDPTGFDPWNAVALAALFGILVGLVVAWRSRRGRPWIFVGTCWFLGVLVPVSGLVQIGSQSRADRYTYLPAIGLYMFVVWCLWESGARARRVALGVGILVLGAFALTTMRQAHVWSDSRTLFEHTLAVTDDNYIALIQLGDVARKEGDLETAERLLLKSGAIHADSGLYSNLSAVQYAREKYPSAEKHARRAIELDDNNSKAHLNLGIVLGNTGRPAAAELSFLRAAELRPGYTDAWFNLGLLYRFQGKRKQAAKSFRRVLELDPGWIEVQELLHEVGATRADPRT